MSSPLRLAYQVFGVRSEARSSILILHGMFGSSNNWRSVGKKIASEIGTAIYAVDARNHGNSDHVSQMDYHLMSEETIEFCRQHQLQKVSIIGHSMGGKTGMLMALGHPELVEKLVVVDVAPTPAPGREESEDRVQVMKSLNLFALKTRKEANSILQSRIPDSSIRDFLLSNLLRSPDGEGMRWRFNLAGIADNMHILKDFPDMHDDACFLGQTLFLGGERSNYITEESAVEISRLFPRARIAHIPDAGHWVHYDQPDRFLAAVTDFLKSH